MHGIPLDQVSGVSQSNPVNRIRLLRERLLSVLGTGKVEPHHTNLLEEPFTELNLVTQRRNERPPAFLFDPFICEALNARGLYPPVPTREEFATKGLSLDSKGLKKAIRTLLSRAEAPLSKEILYTGVGNVACFSPKVHMYLLEKFGDVLRKEIQNFFSKGQLLEQASHSGQADHPSVGGGPLTVMQEEIDEAISQRDDANRRYWRLAKQNQHQPPFRIPMPDGSLATAVQVDNLVFDPRVEREPGQKGKKLPTFCSKAIAVILHGSKEPRPDGPGWRWTLRSKMNEFRNWTREGIEAGHRSQWLREMNLDDRMMTMYVVPTARKNCIVRRKLEKSLQAKNRTQQHNGFRLLDNPSPKTTHNKIIPAFLNLFGLWVVEVLKDPSTVRIGASSDGMKAKSCGLLGTYFSVFQRISEFRDPMGNVKKKTRCLRFPGPITQTSNKLVKTLKDSSGRAFPPEAAFGMAKALYVGNLAGYFLENTHMIDMCLDGGPENKGCGPAHEIAERMCGENSLFDQLIADRSIWREVIKQADEWGMKGPIDAFFGNDGVRWEEEWSSDKRAPASTTLDTRGPVYKAREVVDMLSDYQKEESAKLVQQYRWVRPYAMRWLTRMRCRMECEKIVSEKKAAKFRQVKPDKDPAAHYSKFRLRLSARHTQSFKSSILRMRYAEAVPRSAANGRQARVRPISMKRNPLRFLPCRRRADGKRLGLVNHCGCHRIHNLTRLYVKSLNAGLLEQVVSLAKWTRCDWYWPDMSAAIDLLFGPPEAINDADMKFFTDVRAQVDVNRLARECKYEAAKGIRKPSNTALTRWGTVMGAGSHAFVHHKLLAFGIIKWWAHGRLDVRVRAAVKVLSPEGFDSEDFQQLRFEDCAKTVFAFLTNVSDILQLAIMHVLNAVVVRLLLAAFSANYECGVPLTMGVDSLVRAILMVLRRDIWVRCFPGCGWRGLGWNRTLAVGCRTYGAEYHSDRSVRLLRPDCKAKVKARLGDWQLPEPADSSSFNKLLDNAARAVDEFMEAAKMLAGRRGRMLPEDMDKAWSKMWAESHSKARAKPDFGEGKESYAGRLSQAQYALHRVCEDSLEAIVEGCQRELFAMYGSIANMGKVRKTGKEFTFRTQDGGQIKSSVLVPDRFAIPNAVSTLVLVRDLRAHYREAGIDPDRLAEHLPTWGDVVRDKCYSQLVEYGGFNIKLGQALESEFSDHTEWNQRRCHRPNAQGVNAVTEDGDIDLQAHRTFEKTLSCYDGLYQCSEGAGQTQSTSKGMESAFSPITVIGKSKGPAKLRALDGIARRGVFAGAGIDPERVLKEEALYWNAEKLALHPGFDGWARARDTIKGMRMDEAVKEDTLPEYARKGGSFPVTNHGISSRSKKFQERSVASAKASDLKRALAAKRPRRPRPAMEAAELELRKRARAILGSARAPRSITRTAKIGAARAAVQRLPCRPRIVHPEVQRRSESDQDRTAAPPHEAGDLWSDNDDVGETVGCPTPELLAQKRRSAESKTPSSDDDDSDIDTPLMLRCRGNKRQKLDSAASVPPRAVSRKAQAKQPLTTSLPVTARGDSDCSTDRLGGGGGGSAGSGGDRGGGKGGGRGGLGVGGGGRGGRGPGGGEGRGGRGGGGGRGSRGRGCVSMGGGGGGDASATTRRGRGTGRGGGSGLGGPQMAADARCDMCDSDDELPLFQNHQIPLANGPHDGAAGDSERAAQERQPSAQAGPASGSSLLSTVTTKNVWGKALCFQYYGQPGRFRPSSACFIPAKNSKPAMYEVKRNISDVLGGSIRFPVRVAEHRMFYIAYTEETGPFLINVVKLARETDNNWSDTIQVYRVYTASEAILRTDRVDDVFDDRGQVEALGRDTLTRIAEEDSANRRTTYHCGDRLFWMDVRNVVGVVRWAPLSHRGAPFKKLSEAEPSLSRTDILYVGTSVSEPPPQPPRT